MLLCRLLVTYHACVWFRSGFDRVGLDLSVYGVDVALVMPFVAGFAVFLMGAGACKLFGLCL